jgi:hypothetical protein
MAYSSTFSTLTNPQATDRLNNPSHSALHQAENAAILEIERAVGLDSSVLGTVIGDLRNAASNGGGHVQTANKGGTGQTTFNKGDVLVAQSTSVLSKLAIGIDGTFLQADSTQATGVKWGNVAANKIALITTPASVVSSSALTTLFTTTIPGSTLGTNNAIRFKAYLSQISINNSDITLTANYGGNSVFALHSNNQSGPVVLGAQGFIEGMIVGAASVTSQKAFGQVYANNPGVESTGLTIAIPKLEIMAYGTSSINSTADQPFTLTAQFGNTQGSIVTQFMVVERIV